MQTITVDIAIVGAGGAGIRAAIEAAKNNPDFTVALISKVYPMRSHTVAAEGGSAAVRQETDSLELHFNDTVSGGDWLCDQDVVEYFVQQCPHEMIQLEQWGCPWSRKPDGSINVRNFGGMKVARTWFAADKTGFHILHTLFQTSLKYPQIRRLDEHFVLDILVDDGRVAGVVVLNMLEGELVQVRAGAVVFATGGAGRVYRYNTNASVVTGEGMGIAYRHGVALRDMEFVQYHPTGLPGSGILITEASRGEGGVLLNKDGYRYLQDYGLGPETPLGQPKPKFMELGPRDKVSQAFWHEWRAGRMVHSPQGDYSLLDIRHLGREKILERLPMIRELAIEYMGIDPIDAPIPVRPTAHYTMGGIATNQQCESSIKGLFAAGECSSVGMHGANRLGSNSLAEILVFGALAGQGAVMRSREGVKSNAAALDAQAKDVEKSFAGLLRQKGKEKWSVIRDEMGLAMEDGCGIYRSEELMQKTINKLAELQDRIKKVGIVDSSAVFNTDVLNLIEIGYGLDVAEGMAHSAMQRKESRGAHQRLDESCKTRDDKNFLKHSLAYYKKGSAPRIEYGPVNITKLPPAKRVYGAEGASQDKQNKEKGNG
ncbi:fumarate reductase (quinol) flavoprotein subunit [Candidatus Desulfovibrio trichonymphae]|uniref:Fumarate reductase flavoprotein subunit n=1 Tax=Candidatus Desulfovibrio trichonymphae TaxID=1725232 RepID=A0A1J1DNZ4_9BACT|nr:fumarate reductase (quinol) flavoprotein subunit [Candidatus Desulfovibrio trichonymphae]BAV91559.1 fumarate reductase flavoprotein subunit A [Candidatus Desulfovibrio trichonymphae]